MCLYPFWINHPLNSLIDHLPNLKPLGCYHDESNDRALPDYYANFRRQIDWTQLDETIYQCGQVAYNKGYYYFAVQDYGECYSGNNASATYAKHNKPRRKKYFFLLGALRLVNAASPRTISVHKKKISSGTQGSVQTPAVLKNKIGERDVCTQANWHRKYFHTNSSNTTQVEP